LNKAYLDIKSQKCQIY